MKQFYAAAARSVIRFRQAGRGQIRRRPAVVGWRRSGVARSRTAASGRRSARRLHDRSSRGRSDHAQLGGRHPFSTVDDQRRLRGRQRRQFAARRSDVQDGARSFAHRSGVVLAVDNIAVGEFAGRSRPAADGQGDGRSVLRVLRHGSQTDHAGHRRHVRCDPRWSAVAAVQRPLRRIRISADRRVRRRGPLHHRRASPRQAAERQGDQALPEAPVARDPRSLA